LFCTKCGSQLNEGSVFCSRCGVQVAQATGPLAEEVSQKSRLAVTLLSCPVLYVGLFGAHRFYMGKIKTAVLMLLLGVAAAICYFSYMAVFFTTFMEFDEAEPPLVMFLILGLSWLFGMAVGIWALIDFIIAVTGNFKDSQGKPIKKW
jgi:hypothetical protein